MSLKESTFYVRQMWNISTLLYKNGSIRVEFRNNEQKFKSIKKRYQKSERGQTGQKSLTCIQLPTTILSYLVKRKYVFILII